jgi:predicted nucleic-acid-binding Zn-ribbon protein
LIDIGGMKQSGRCPKCGSADIVADAKAIYMKYAEADLSLATYRNPEAAIFRGKQTTTLSAWLCVGCGYVEIYADTPQKLRIAETGPPSL